MAKPYIHALSSVKRYGGTVADYMPIHELLDSSKSAMADNRHRVLTHSSWFLSVILPRIFGETAVNSDGKTYSVRDIGEQHVLEDYGLAFIPTPLDFLQELPFADWMNGGGGEPPPSYKKIAEKRKKYVLVD